MSPFPKVRQIRDNEVEFLSPLSITFDYVAAAIKELGKVKRTDKEQQLIIGRIKYGLQSVKIRASLVERHEGITTVVLQGSSDDIWGAGAKSAIKRLVEYLLNLDNPGYKPDRLGMSPAALVGIIFGFIILLFIILTIVMNIFSY